MSLYRTEIFIKGTLLASCMCPSPTKDANPLIWNNYKQANKYYNIIFYSGLKNVV
jgi:hypothetical protein